MKHEFSKKLLFADYIIFVILVICNVMWGSYVDLTTVIVAWVAQLGISSAAYYWKAKSENRVKVPVKVIESLPESVRENLDMTQIITSIIQSE